MAHPELVYKKLDEAALGYEEAKRWVVSNVSEVLHYIDELRNEVDTLVKEATYNDRQAEVEEHRLNTIIMELEWELEKAKEKADPHKF